MQEENEILTAEDVKELNPLYENVILALKQVYDPEIPVNIYDLGLIYELNIRKNREAYVPLSSFLGEIALGIAVYTVVAFLHVRLHIASVR